MSEQAGRELDALIAEKVMGWLWWKSSGTGRRCLFQECPPEWFKERATGDEPLVGDWDRLTHIPRYSTRISDAWQVVEKAIDYQAATTDFDDATGKPTTHRWELWFGTRGEAHYGKAFAATASLTICLAALQAIAADSGAQPGRKA